MRHNSAFQPYASREPAIIGASVGLGATLAAAEALSLTGFDVRTR